MEYELAMNSQAGLIGFHYFHYCFDSVQFVHKNLNYGSVLSSLLATL